MEQEISKIIAEYGVHTVVIALIINLLTNFIKKPIKAYVKKSGKNINKYISFIPIILGFAGACVYLGFTAGWTSLKVDEVFTLGISSSSLSLALFAVIEKFIIKATGKEAVVIDEIAGLTDSSDVVSIATHDADKVIEAEEVKHETIILGNKKHET